MTVPIVVGLVVGLIAAVVGFFRAVTGTNPLVARNPDGTVHNLWPTSIGMGLLWGGVAFGVALVITLLV